MTATLVMTRGGTRLRRLARRERGLARQPAGRRARSGAAARRPARPSRWPTCASTTTRRRAGSRARARSARRRTSAVRSRRRIAKSGRSRRWYVGGESGRRRPFRRGAAPAFQAVGRSSSDGMPPASSRLAGQRRGDYDGDCDRRSARVAATGLVVLAMASGGADRGGDELLVERFSGPDRLLANERSRVGGVGPRSVRWRVTSGSLFVRGGVGGRGCPTATRRAAARGGRPARRCSASSRGARTSATSRSRSRCARCAWCRRARTPAARLRRCPRAAALPLASASSTRSASAVATARSWSARRSRAARRTAGATATSAPRVPLPMALGADRRIACGCATCAGAGTAIRVLVDGRSVLLVDGRRRRRPAADRQRPRRPARRQHRADDRRPRRARAALSAPRGAAAAAAAPVAVRTRAAPSARARGPRGADRSLACLRADAHRPARRAQAGARLEHAGPNLVELDAAVRAAGAAPPIAISVAKRARRPSTAYSSAWFLRRLP